MKRKLFYLFSVLALALICVCSINFKPTYAKTYPKNGYKLGTTATVKVKTYLRSDYNSKSAKICAVKRKSTINLYGSIYYDVENDIHWCLAYDLDNSLIGYINLNHVKNIKAAKSTNDWDNIGRLSKIATLAAAKGISGLGENPPIDLAETYLSFLRNPKSAEYIANKVDDKTFINLLRTFREDTELFDPEQQKEYYELVSNPEIFTILEKRSLDIVKYRLIDSGVHYFTNNGKACIEGVHKKSHGCKNCDLKYIMNYTDKNSPNKCEWYDDIFPEFDVYGCSMVPYSYSKDGKTSGGGQSCFAFGNWCAWFTYSVIYGNTNMHEENQYAIYAKGDFNKDFITKNARIGDIIRLNESHTVVLYSIDDTGIYVIDNNSGNDPDRNAKGNNIVKYHHINWSAYSKAVVSRPTPRVYDPTDTSKELLAF